MAGLQIAIVGLLGIALSRLRLPLNPTPPTAVILVDRSDSAASRIPSPSKCLTDLTKQFPALKAYRTTMAWFAGSSGWLTSPPPVWPDIPASRQTNIAEALRLAGRTDPQLVILFSDGRQTRGDAGAILETFVRKNIPVLLVAPPPAKKPDVQLTSFQAFPEGHHTRFRAVVSADRDVSVHLTAWKLNGVRLPVEKRTLRMIPDRPREIRFVDSTPTGGLTRYEAQVELPSDREPDNNRLFAAVRRRGAMHVLLVGSGLEADPGDRFRRIGPGDFPETVAGLSPYDIVILADVQTDRLSARAIAALRAFLLHAGGGLVVVGGPEVFGNRSRNASELQRLLPVRSDPRRLKPLDLILLLDTSGSMSERRGELSKLDASRRAVMELKTILSKNDRLELIAFAETPNHLCKLLPIQWSKIQNHLYRTTAHGGTRLNPALDLAENSLQGASRSKDRNRHVLLLTDGRTELLDTAARAKRFRQLGATLSVVVTGESSRTRQLADLARKTGGRYYPPEKVSDLATVFRTDLQSVLLADPRLKPAAVRVLSDALNVKLPPVGRRALTVLKKRAILLARAETGEPIIAGWRIGLGRSLAVTTRLTAGGTPAWSAPKILQPLLHFLTHWKYTPRLNPDYRLRAEFSDDDLVISVDAEHDGEPINHAKLTAYIGAPDRSGREIPMSQIAPGRYNARREETQSGTYIVSVKEAALSLRGRMIVNRGYPREYDFSIPPLGGKENWLNWNEDHPFSIPAPRKAYAKIDIAPWCLLLALLIMSAEMIVRKVILS